MSGIDEHSEHEEHDEGWLVSYADMVTLLFGFFVIMYSMSNVEEKKFSEMGKSIAKSFNKDTPLSGEETAPATSLMSDEEQQVRAFQMLVAILNLGDPNSAVRKVAKAYQEMQDGKSIGDIAKNHFGRTETPANTQAKDMLDALNESTTEIIIPTDLLFQPATANLKPDAKVRLQKLAKMLLRTNEFATFKIEAHTDSAGAKIGMDQYGIDMTTRQAKILESYFVNSGIDANSIISSGRSSNFPLAAVSVNDPKVAKENDLKNRRIHIIILRKGS